MVRRLALFDLDDTLVDHVGAFRRWADEFTREYGLPDDAPSWLLNARRELPGPKHRLFDAAKEHFRLPGTVDEHWAHYRARLPELVRCRPGVIDGLRLLRQHGWALVVISNGASDTQLAKLRLTRLIDHVDAYCISADVGLRKPDPRFYEVAAKRVGLAIGAAWMVGDDPVQDILGADRLGLFTCWVSHGRVWGELAADPTVSVVDTRDAIEYLLLHSESHYPRGSI